MDFIRKYDIELEREHYYAGERLRGFVIIENIENLRVTGVQLFLRGKAHVEWRITRGGERRTVKEDEYFIDEKLIVWGSDSLTSADGSISILPRGDHRFPFEFQLPITCLPCSFESRIGTVRYYLRVIIDIPYASPPQGLKYFTLIGPYIDCMDNRYTTPVSAMKQTTNKKCLLCCCCVSGPISLEASLEQTAYCCGESIRVKCDVQNGSDQNVTLFCRLVQFVEFRINKGAFGLTKDLSHNVLELLCPSVTAHSTRSFHDLSADLEVPVMPPTLVDVCKVIEINYVLRIGLHLEKSGDDLQMDFPFVVATVPHPFHTGGRSPELSYEAADEHVEGGIYVSPEFQLGQVYDGATAGNEVVEEEEEEAILYRPVYICVVRRRSGTVSVGQLSNGHSPSNSQVAATTTTFASASTALSSSASFSSHCPTSSAAVDRGGGSSFTAAAAAAAAIASYDRPTTTTAATSSIYTRQYHHHQHHHHQQQQHHHQHHHQQQHQQLLSSTSPPAAAAAAYVSSSPQLSASVATTNGAERIEQRRGSRQTAPGRDTALKGIAMMEDKEEAEKENKETGKNEKEGAIWRKHVEGRMQRNDSTHLPLGQGTGTPNHRHSTQPGSGRREAGGGEGGGGGKGGGGGTAGTCDVREIRNTGEEWSTTRTKEEGSEKWKEEEKTTEKMEKIEKMEKTSESSNPNSVVNHHQHQHSHLSSTIHTKTTTITSATTTNTTSATTTTTTTSAATTTTTTTTSATTTTTSAATTTTTSGAATTTTTSAADAAIVLHPSSETRHPQSMQADSREGGGNGEGGRGEEGRGEGGKDGRGKEVSAELKHHCKELQSSPNSSSYSSSSFSKPLVTSKTLLSDKQHEQQQQQPKEQQQQQQPKEQQQPQQLIIAAATVSRIESESKMRTDATTTTTTMTMTTMTGEEGERSTPGGSRIEMKELKNDAKRPTNRKKKMAEEEEEEVERLNEEDDGDDPGGGGRLGDDTGGDVTGCAFMATGSSVKKGSSSSGSRIASTTFDEVTMSPEAGNVAARAMTLGGEKGKAILKHEEKEKRRGGKDGEFGSYQINTDKEDGLCREKRSRTEIVVQSAINTVNASSAVTVSSPSFNDASAPINNLNDRVKPS